MITYDNPSYANYIVERANGRRGMSVSTIPLAAKDDLRRLVSAGRVKIIGRVSAVSGTRVSYVVGI